MFYGFRAKCALLIFVIFLSSCHADKQKDKEEKFARVYGEVLFFSEKFKNDTLELKRKIDSVLSVNKMTMTQIDSLANVYVKNPKRWSEFFEKVKKYLEDKKLNVQKKH